MKKYLKVKCVINSILIVIGIISIVISLKISNLGELQQGYMSGFGISITIISVMQLIKNLLSLRNSDTLRKREIELTDERFNNIYTKSMATTFKICMLAEGLLSVILVFMNNSYGIDLGLLVGIQLIVFLICNVIISRKI